MDKIFETIKDLMPIYRQTLDHYGATAQVAKTIEELNELVYELCCTPPYSRCEGADDINNFESLFGETADVLNMLVKLMMICAHRHPQAYEHIADLMRFKMERTMQRISGNGS